MNVLFDGRVLKHRQTTGVQRYAHSVLKALKTRGLNIDIVMPGTHNRHFQHIWEHTVLPVRARNYDILFCPGNMSPLWKPPGIRLITVIHDLTFRFYKDTFSRSYRLYHELTLPVIMKLSDRIITVSESEKRVISGLYPEYEHKIRAVHNGVDADFIVDITKKNAVSPVITGDQQLDSRLLETGYLLFTGSLNRRKNLQGVMQAWELIRDCTPLTLVIAGPEGAVFQSPGIHIPSSGQSESADNQIISNKKTVFTGYVSEKVLKRLYRHATALLFPSFYEGFGLPVLEAMASGCPVITSNISSLPEVAGDAAILVDPHNIEDIAHKTLKLLQDKELRHRLIEKGLKRASGFTWDRTAEKLISVFEE